MGADLVELAEAAEEGFADAGFVLADAVQGEERTGGGGENADEEAAKSQPEDEPGRLTSFHRTESR